VNELALAEVCHRHGVSLVVLFGSHAQGTARPDSDMDLGILSREIRAVAGLCRVPGPHHGDPQPPGPRYDTIDERLVYASVQPIRAEFTRYIEQIHRYLQGQK